MSDMVKDFLHVPGVAHNATREESEQLIERYRSEKK